MVTLKGPSKVATIAFSETRLVAIVKSKTKNRLPITNHVFSRYLHASARTAAQIFSGLNGGVDRLFKQTLRGSRGGVEDIRIEAKNTKKSGAKTKNSPSEDRPSRGQGQECSRTQAQVFSKKKSSKNVSGVSKKKVFKNFFHAISKKKSLKHFFRRFAKL